MDSKPTEASEAPITQEPSKPPKQKKPRTEAQQAATAKALAVMAQRRKQVNEEKKEKKEKVKIAKKAVEEKILKEDIGFVMKNDFESLKKELYELRGMINTHQSTKPEKPTPVAPKERVVERIVERVPERSTTPSRLTGHALLDKVFGFEK